MRSTLAIVALLLVFGLGFYVAWRWARPAEPIVAETSADVLLERIETVAKLVTVEGYFSEVYAHKDFRRVLPTPYWDRLLMEIPALRKQALIRVRGKVSVGYDLDRLRIDMDAETRTVTLSNLPEPSIIATEHDLEYFDLDEGVFNRFYEEDYNRINARAKELIVEEARESRLFAQAEEQGNELIELIILIAGEAGWSVEVEGRPVLAD